MIDLNCGGVVAMGLVCIPYMSAGSRMLNVASQSAFQPLPYLNIYGATKAFVRNYSRALNIELKERGITVTAVCPGWMDTDLFDRARVGAKKAPRKFAGMGNAGQGGQEGPVRREKGEGYIRIWGLCEVLSHAGKGAAPKAYDEDLADSAGPVGAYFIDVKHQGFNSDPNKTFGDIQHGTRAHERLFCKAN